MAFDPNLPAENSPLSSAEMRQQLQGLRELINTIPQGEQGPPGEVSQSDLESVMYSSANRVDAVTPLGMTISDPPQQYEVEAILMKLDELISALERF